MSDTAKPRKVYFALYEGVQILDVTGPAEVLAQANIEAGRAEYDVRFIYSGAQPGQLKTSAGLSLFVEPAPKRLKNIHSLVVPGADLNSLENALANKPFMAWLGKASALAKRNISVCSGAFIFGALGLLHERKVTTHWMASEQLQRDYPSALVAQDALYLQENNLWTSAGVLSGVDMMLAIVSKDLGKEIALKIARNLVVFLFREGGQSQFSAPIDLQHKSDRVDLQGLVSWLEARLHQVVTVEQMAAYLSMSLRSLYRRCQAAFSLSPAQLLSELRLERSRNLLQQAKLSVKRIAFDCGYANSAAYSKAFSRRFGISPSLYRQRF